MPLRVNSDAYCRKTVLTCAHTLDTRRDPKPHRTRCALFHQTAATGTAVATANSKQAKAVMHEHVP